VITHNRHEPQPEEDRMTAAAATHDAPAEIVNDCSTYYGLHLVDVGEDGDVIVLGHHDDRRVVAAINRHARTVWGEPISDQYDAALLNLTQRWAKLMTRCENATEKWHDEDRACSLCAEIQQAGWWLRWNADAGEPGAFPVTRWAS
jgi:hypothetical protein